MRIASIEPTVLLIRKSSGLFRVLNVQVQNPDPPVVAGIMSCAGANVQEAYSGVIRTGTETYEALVSEVDHPSTVVLEVRAGGAMVARAEAPLLPGRHWTVHVVPVTHHDVGYTAPIEVILSRYDSFYRDIISFCRETSGFPREAQYRYTVESVWSLDHFLRHASQAVKREMIALIREGRIEVSALYVQPIDAFCGHEEIIRLLYPAFALKRKYGIPVRSACLVDIPGLAWGLASVIRSAGIPYLFAGFPTCFEWDPARKEHGFWDDATMLPNGRPTAFHWQGPDGRELLVYYQGGYGWFPGGMFTPTFDDLRRTIAEGLRGMERSGVPFDIARHVDRGDDNCPPAVQISHFVREWNERYAYPRLVISTNAEFFDALSRQHFQCRSFSGELPHTDYVVCATSEAFVTGVSRRTHEVLLSGEKMATLAFLLCHNADPRGEVDQAYRDMLLYDEHCFGMGDQLGAAQAWNWSSKSHFAYRASALAQRVLDAGVNRLAGAISVPTGAHYVTVFNSLSFRRTDPVILPYFAAPHDGVELEDLETGARIPCQINVIDSPETPMPEAAGRYAKGKPHARFSRDLCFIAPDVPSLGFKTFRMVPRTRVDTTERGVIRQGGLLENRFYRLTLDEHSGMITSIHDKELDREILDPGAPFGFNSLVIRDIERGSVEHTTRITARAGLNGPVVCSIRAKGSLPGCPVLVQEVTLYTAIKRIDVANRILKDSTPFQEVFFFFPFLVPRPRFTFEGTGAVVRPFVDQFPGSNTNYYAVQHWVKVEGEDISILFSPLDSHLLMLGGMWPSYVSNAHHGITPQDFGRPFIEREGIRTGHIASWVMNNNYRTNFAPTQVGEVLFRYSFTTGLPSASGDRFHFGWAATNPLHAREHDGSDHGDLPPAMSFCAVEPENVSLMTLKAAEDGGGTILRLTEMQGTACVAAVSFSRLRLEGAALVSVVEEDMEGLETDGDTVRVALKPQETKTLRIRFAPHTSGKNKRNAEG